MAFDKPTRNRLASFVGKARDLIADEFTQQFQSLYGISEKGTITPLDQLGHLDDTGLATAALLRERIDYLVKTHPDDREGTKSAVARLAREQAFTVLNRLAAIRMAEKRGLIVESVGKGYQSKGFKVFEQVAGSGLGDTYHRYCRYLFCLFDELAVDLGVLFDRRSPHGLLFPRETALLALFDLLNAVDLDPLWAEDETIGWVYQYYNDPAERKKMREHAAPRNSRELAVRNQFFTPRYVVEFLTDNTLGRIWYEMTKGETRLAVQCRYLVRRPTEVFLNPDESAPVVPERQGLSQEELLKQPVYIPHRQIKDPRELRMLDPACGSMHFGLYAFDLYEVIYEEAWDMGIESLHRDFPDKETFLREVPRLIIEHNIHGIDIDPRAAQIAGLSLWLRAQKSWQAQKVPAGQRPRIIRSNIVCAEPMPGEKELLREFTTRLEVPALGYLVEQVFNKMQLAGEAGSLLKIEEEIRDIIAEAKRRWQEVPKLKQMGLFGHASINPVQAELPLDFSGITDERFWEGAEDKVYQALQDYSEVAGEHGYQRRLFAEDAARGFAFIDICRKRYDVVVMNPPFGAPPESVAWMVPSDAANNIYPAFVLRGAQLSDGFIGAITDRTFVVQQSFGKFRNRLASDLGLIALVELGWGVLDDADVQVAAYVVKKGDERCHLFATIGGYESNPTDRLCSVVANGQWTVLTSEVIHKLPNNAFAHTLPMAYLEHLETQSALKDMSTLPRGLGSNDANRTYKAWYEVPEGSIGEGRRYRSLSNGGSCSPFFRDDSGVAEWLRADGKILVDEGYSETKKAYDQKGTSDYFLAGLSFPKQSSVFNVAVLTEDAIPTREGKGIIPKKKEDRLLLLAYLNSAYARFFVEATNGLHKQSGPVGMAPVPTFSEAGAAELTYIALSSWQLIANTYTYDEASRYFSRPIGQTSSEIFPHIDSSGIFDKLDSIIFMETGLDPADHEIIVRSKRPELAPYLPSEADILLYTVGIAFGRWDIRFATGEKPVPELPDPFSPLPVCPPGMLQNANGLPAEPKDVPTDYPLRISWPGILVDDENNPEDIVARVEDVLKVIWNDRWEAIEHEACELLGVKTLRDFFRRPTGFFADHLKRYSKSRRQAPIYWPLSTAKGSYTLWIYYHRLTDQTLHTALADFVDPKLKSIRAEISALRESGTHRDRLEELLDLEKELADFHTEIERIIKLPWKPNLNDGVLITASPLWKLFRLPKWQKDLKACWEKLEKGDYDWAHLAYSIWPKRVEDVCRKDRSIAIAHGLEHLCQVEPPKQKGTRGKKKAVQADFDEMEG